MGDGLVRVFAHENACGRGPIDPAGRVGLEKKFAVGQGFAELDAQGPAGRVLQGDRNAVSVDLNHLPRRQCPGPALFYG